MGGALLRHQRGRALRLPVGGERPRGPLRQAQRLVLHGLHQRHSHRRSNGQTDGRDRQLADVCLGGGLPRAHRRPPRRGHVRPGHGDHGPAEPLQGALRCLARGHPSKRRGDPLRGVRRLHHEEGRPTRLHLPLHAHRALLLARPYAYSGAAGLDVEAFLGDRPREEVLHARHVEPRHLRRRLHRGRRTRSGRLLLHRLERRRHALCVHALLAGEHTGRLRRGQDAQRRVATPVLPGRAPVGIRLRRRQPQHDRPLPQPRPPRRAGTATDEVRAGAHRRQCCPDPRPGVHAPPRGLQPWIPGHHRPHLERALPGQQDSGGRPVRPAAGYPGDRGGRGVRGSVGRR